MALNELKSARTIALNLNYIEPEDKELYTIFNTKNLSIPVRFKIEQDLVLGENEAPISSSSYSLANISGVPLFLFGTKLIDSEIVKIENELNEIDDLFPALRENIKLLEKKKAIPFIEGIEEDLLAVKSLELVISKLRVFIDNTNYKFISVDENKVLTNTHYPNLFKSIIVLSLLLIISLIVALYNSERVIRYK